ncbi:hypothetical protein M0R45_029997 [Rubus argutus]|uniref:Uncharacterized protein n=1 Tax=Rubus argutus TaxID=59490 RepID=A0AAW1WA54_RUBAR
MTITHTNLEKRTKLQSDNLEDRKTIDSKNRCWVQRTQSNRLPVVVGDGLTTYDAIRDVASDGWRGSDGFTFGIAFRVQGRVLRNGANTTSQLSPCDSRLSLSSSNSQIAVFRPKVERDLSPHPSTPPSLSLRVLMGFRDSYGGYMVAFAGHNRLQGLLLAFVGQYTYTVTKLYSCKCLSSPRAGCRTCIGKGMGAPNVQGIPALFASTIRTVQSRQQRCKNKGGNVDCSLGIQLAFSGTDKHLSVLNSWYEVKNLGQYSLYGLYSNLKDSLTSQYNKFF